MIISGLIMKCIDFLKVILHKMLTNEVFLVMELNKKKISSTLFSKVQPAYFVVRFR